MAAEKKPMATTNFEQFTQLADMQAESMYPVRDKNDYKLEASDLFLHFTANIIKEDVQFIR
ncbi:MAG TPA: hypothetical protein VL307_11940 [Chitinophagaceae bacterium]|nr:hypothetical protein [Chitinophagaceae bacterium]